MIDFNKTPLNNIITGVSFFSLPIYVFFFLFVFKRELITSNDLVTTLLISSGAALPFMLVNFISMSLMAYNFNTDKFQGMLITGNIFGIAFFSLPILLHIFYPITFTFAVRIVVIAQLLWLGITIIANLSASGKKEEKLEPTGQE
ncbi:hypothetical protein MYP_4991 [Sporocytophaga myxococcoides]|uniref:Uncharacterized protein n=1 Tax=Sporocytophaga myxococcoides TaxID=153721 RepID=A0A098LLD3_9BACT|nr:hypothetical protein [Sporocytophaga myxococcoides]GAL87760.1 hypothetical protein MYP_4991 [Sporocytophaga myxococcoides]